MKGKHRDAAAYELGVLDDADEFETHLGGCPRCRELLAGFHPVSTALAEAARLGYLPGGGGPPDSGESPGSAGPGSPAFGGTAGGSAGAGSPGSGGLAGAGSPPPGSSAGPGSPAFGGSADRSPADTGSPALGGSAHRGPIDAGSPTLGGPAHRSPAEHGSSSAGGAPAFGGSPSAGDPAFGGSTRQPDLSYPAPNAGATRRRKPCVFSRRRGMATGALLLIALGAAVTVGFAARPATARTWFAPAASIVSPALVVAGTGHDLRDLPWSAGFQ